MSVQSQEGKQSGEADCRHMTTISQFVSDSLVSSLCWLGANTTFSTWLGANTTYSTW